MTVGLAERKRPSITNMERVAKRSDWEWSSKMKVLMRQGDAVHQVEDDHFECNLV